LRIGFSLSTRGPWAMSTTRLNRRAHRHESKNSERLSFAPLSFEQAIKAALATKPIKDDQDQDDLSGDRS